MKEASQAAINQALAFQRRHEPLFSADAQDPLRKIISFGMVEDVSHWVNEKLEEKEEAKPEPIKFIQEGKEYIVFENPLGETRITALRGGERYVK